MPVVSPTTSDEPKPPGLVTETLLSFSQAAAMFPPFRRGRPVSPSCVWRWFRYGVRISNERVVRLEAVKVAGRHLTTVEAVHRFIASQQIHESPVPNCPVKNSRASRSPAQRQRDSERALEQLKRRRHVADKSSEDTVKSPTVAR